MNEKEKYSETLIGGLNELNNPRILAIDESLFLLNTNGDQFWILGGVENEERRIRLKITKS